jgi:hypothetical protein
MVLFDFLSKRNTPLQHRAHPVWLYTGENDTTWLEHSRRSDLDMNLLEALTRLLATTSTPTNACQFSWTWRRGHNS